MKAVVEILDAVPLAEGVRVRLLHLDNADATSVVTILREIFTQGKQLAGRTGSSVAGKAEPETAAGKALVNTFNVSADIRTNTLVHERRGRVAGPGRTRRQGPGPRLGQTGDRGPVFPPEVRRPDETAAGPAVGVRRDGGAGGRHRGPEDAGHAPADDPGETGAAHHRDSQDPGGPDDPGRRLDEHPGGGGPQATSCR